MGGFAAPGDPPRRPGPQPSPGVWQRGGCQRRLTREGPSMSDRAATQIGAVPRTAREPVGDAPDTDPEVLIIGAGPVGLFAAILLREKGIRVEIVDQEERPAARTTSTGFCGRIIRSPCWSATTPSAATSGGGSWGRSAGRTPGRPHRLGSSTTPPASFRASRRQATIWIICCARSGSIWRQGEPPLVLPRFTRRRASSSRCTGSTGRSGSRSTLRAS
ncbi:MAG TPA: FAD-dependent oxidoreductase [Thermoanaerobaculia bacterium]|nr:FAD-dependent oxidoreductase [Thermoanaerobaculia bacterium]